MSRAPSFWRLGWRSLWRDWRAGDLRLLVLAVTLAVAAVSAVGFFSDRLQGGLQRDARQLLGGDVVLVSDHLLPPVFTEQATAAGLKSNLSLTFSTMARAPESLGGATRLVSLKAVTSGYPLRGELLVSEAHAEDPQKGGDKLLGQMVEPHAAYQHQAPIPGQAWVDEAVLTALGLHLGDDLDLGDSSLRITKVLVQEPDRGAGFMNLAPRVMINQADLPASHLVQPASRLRYRWAAIGQPEAVKTFTQWAERTLEEGASQGLRGIQLETLDKGRPEVKQTLDRAAQFLNLVALLAALLSAVALALAARSFAAKHLDDCALQRVLGQSQSSIAATFAFEFLTAGLLASGLGLLLGFGLHHVFVWLLQGLVSTELPSTSWVPAGLGLALGMTLLVAFGLPPVLQLAQVPPLRVIRRELGAIRPASIGVLALGVLGFATLLLVLSHDLKLGLIAVGGFAGAVLVFAGLAALALQLLRRSVNEATAPRWLVLATRQMTARPVQSVVQVSALAVGMLALMLLILLRTDLINSWRQASPPGAPNRFVINVLPEQSQAFQKALSQAGVDRFDWFPMFRGRLLSRNGQPLNADQFTEERAKQLVEREFNLSNSAELPHHNQIVAGQWVAEEDGAISVEEGIAKTLGLQLGDVLRFDMGGTLSEARITSLRKVDWASMRANFFVMYPKAQMPTISATYLAAYKAPGNTAEASRFDNALVREFPNITSVDLSSTLNQIQTMLDQVIGAVQFLFGFTLAAGMVVLFAAVSATRDERARDFAIMRAVGASGVLLRQVQQAELLGVGLLAGFLASGVANAVGWALAHYVFDFVWQPSWLALIGGSLLGALLAWAAGWWGLRSLLQRPVMQTLRLASE